MVCRASRSTRVAVVAFSTLTRDTRVLRTIGALAGAGYNVAAIGFGSAPPGVSRFVALPAPVRGLANRIGMGLRAAPAALLPAAAIRLHDLTAMHRMASNALGALRPDVMHANDWSTLPAVLAAKSAHGGRIIYDSHEFATEEHAHRRSWRLLMRAQVAAIEARGIAAADRVITVSDGIALALAERYHLATIPTVVRNVPDWREIPFRATSRPRRLLFHGMLKDWRGIEVIVEALSRLPDHVLTLRGETTPSYERKLTAAIRAAGASDRVSLESAVPPAEVVSRASAADLGIFLGPVDTAQNRFALPNKLFEYVMAGLGILVSPGDDMVRLVTRYGFGRAIAPSPDALVALLSGMADTEIDRMKLAALAAARELNWEHERKRLLALYAELVSGTAQRIA